MSAPTRPSQAVAAAVRADEAASLFADLETEAQLLVAVSGGPDSVALLALLAAWADHPARPRLHAATVDHGLRPGSTAEAEGVAALCRGLGVDHTILTWAPSRSGDGLQARARRARYELLAAEAVRLGGAAIVTAHTLDDQAETLLMRLAHGSGPAGLAGMRPRSRRGGTTILRPLLGVAKARLVATAAARALPHVEDPSNRDPRFERVRWRQLMPLLAAHGVEAGRFGVLAARLARQDEALTRRAQAVLAALRRADGRHGGVQLDLVELAAEPEEIVLRVLAQALSEVSDAVAGFPRLERLEACTAALLAAQRARSAIRRTLSGCIVTLDRAGVLTLRPEGPRRRGVHPATS